MGRGLRKSKKPKPWRHASCEAILQHIGRVHFNNQRFFNYHIRFPNGDRYTVCYDWVHKKSDYLRFHPELSNRNCSFSASPQRIIGAIYGGVTRGGGSGSKPRQFSAKPMIRVMRTRLTIWEECGYGHTGIWRNRELEMMPMYRGHLADAIPETRPLTAAERRTVAAREGLARLEDVALPAALVYSDSEWVFGSDSEAE